jgi:hypothetical protein
MHRPDGPAHVQVREDRLGIHEIPNRPACAPSNLNWISDQDFASTATLSTTLLGTRIEPSSVTKVVYSSPSEAIVPSI